MISITITESTEQVVYGIPRSLTLEASIPSTIFYTLDGTDPTIDSDIYVSSITLPVNKTTVVIKIYATNGTEESSIISSTYTGDNKWSAIGQASVVNYSEYNMLADVGYPFGSDGNRTSYSYGPSALSPITDNLTVTDEPTTDGYDADAVKKGLTDLTYDYYTEVYNNLDKYGNTGYGIGTIPTFSTIKKTSPNPNYSSTNDRIFNPRAMVIFQDGIQDDHGNLAASGLNRPSFALPGPEVRDGTYVKLTAHSGSVPTGTFVRSEYNDREQTMTYYYHDRESLRWIISKEPYSSSDFGARNLSQILFLPGSNGIGKVYNWYPYISRKLF